jgi:DNA-directed RNA polymerase specialized sigma subunit
MRAASRTMPSYAKARAVVDGFERARDARAELPPEFRAAIPPLNDRSGDALHAAYQDNPTAENERIVFKHYGPLVLMLAMAKRKRFGEDLDVLVSDGCVGLLSAIRSKTFRAGADFRRYAAVSIKFAFCKGKRDRTWGGGRNTPQQKAARNFRRAFAIQHGTAPTQSQIDAHLATIIVNPQIQIGDGPMVKPISQFPDQDDLREEMESIVDDSVFADQPAIDRDLVRFASKSLRGVDLKAFRMLVKGDRLMDIARALGVSKGLARRILDGVIWRLRALHGLRDALGVSDTEAGIDASGKIVAGSRQEKAGVKRVA